MLGWDHTQKIWVWSRIVDFVRVRQFCVKIRWRGFAPSSGGAGRGYGHRPIRRNGMSQRIGLRVGPGKFQHPVHRGNAKVNAGWIVAQLFHDICEPWCHAPVEAHRRGEQNEDREKKSLHSLRGYTGVEGLGFSASNASILSAMELVCA